MTREDVKKLLMMTECYFPTFRLNPNKVSFTVELWWKVLGEYQYSQIEQALLSYVATDVSGFAPTPGKLIDLVTRIRPSDTLNSNEAWSLVSKAIRNGAYNAKAEFDKLPPAVQKAVGSPHDLFVMATNPEYNEDVEKSHFTRVYDREVKSIEEYKKLPQIVKNEIERTIGELGNNEQKRIGAYDRSGSLHTVQTSQV